MLIDTHVHADGMSIDELKQMVDSGVTHAITCAYYPIVPQYPQTLIDLYHKLIKFDVVRAQDLGLKLYVAIGIHPRSIPEKGYDKAIDAMKSLSENDFVVAYGEVGLEKARTKELRVLEKQAELANEYDIPLIVHTPREKKLEITKKTLSLLNKSKISTNLVVIDHVTPETIPLVHDAGYGIGLTIQHGKLDVDTAANLIVNYEDDLIVLNSDSGFRKSDTTTVSKVLRELKENGANQSLIEKVAFKNAIRIFYKIR